MTVLAWELDCSDSGMLLLKLVCLAPSSLRSFALHCTAQMLTKKRLSFPSLSFKLLYSASGMDNLRDKEMCPVDEASGEESHMSWVIFSDLEAQISFVNKKT